MEPDEQVVLEELYDENYEPTEAGETAEAGGNRAIAGGGDRALVVKAAEQHITTLAGLCAEILEYAKWLGMDTEMEKVRADAVTPGKAAVAACLNHAARPRIFRRNCCGSLGQA